MIRLLLLSDLGSIEARLANLAESANTPSAILNVAQIVATTGSRFVFQFPNTVRMFLDSASKLDGPKEMFELLVMSACGGGRGYTDNQLDQEYRYIRTEAEKRAAEFGQIPILKHFYEQIVDYEIEHAASNARSFPTTEDFEE